MEGRNARIMRGIRYDPERRKGSTLLRRTDLFAILARLAAVFFAVAFALLLAPEKAYAVTYGDVLYGPTVATGPINGNSYYVQVYAFDRYTAALGALGYNPQDSRFTSDVKAYLSNSSTGGAFYDFAQQFTDSPYENDGGSVVGGTVGVDVEDFGMYTAYRQNVNLYGSNVWWANYTTTQSVAARTSVGLVLAGDIAGGGGSGGSGPVTEGDYYVFYVPIALITNASYTTTDQGLNSSFSGFYCTNFANHSGNNSGSDSNNTQLYPNVLTIKILKSCLNRTMNDGDELMIHIKSGMNMSFVVLPSGNTFTKSTVTYTTPTVGDYTGPTYTSELNLLTGTGLYYYTNNVNFKNTNYFTYSDGVLTMKPTYTNRFNFSSYNGALNYGTYDSYNCTTFGYIGYSAPIVEPVPPTNWPTDPTPTPPTQPTVPNPPTGGTPNPPTNPNPPSDPIYGTQPIYVTNTFTADFQGLLDALDEHCKHLQNALFFNFSGFYLLLTTKLTNDFATLRSLITAEFVWLGGTIEQTASDMMLYLKDLFEWLAEQFDFSVSGGGYDDNTVVSWLKKIYSKLGGGVNTRPTDPVSDPFDIGQWLKTLFGNLFTALDDLAGGLLSQLASWVGGLAGKFPFSIPWDVAAILGLLVAEPVAPNFDVPWYTLNGSGTLTQAGLIEVDLADWSQYLEGVRFMIKVCFVMFLAMHTKDFMELMEKAVGLDA